MRCLIDGRVFLDRQPGGVTRVASRLIPAMVRAGREHAWTMGTTGVGVAPSIDLGDTNVAPTHVSMPNKLVALGTWARLTSFDRLIPGEFDVLFLPNLEMVGQPKIPYVLLVHDLSFLVEPRWFIPKTRLWHVAARDKSLIRGAHALLTVSERTKQDLIRLLNIAPEKIQTMPLGLTNHSPTLTDIQKGSPYFLVLGGKDPRKNVACVLAAFEELRKTVDARLVVVGAGLKPAPTVDHPGWDESLSYAAIARPSDTELATLMQNTSALLYPSWYEGFGLPLHEAAHYGRPLIASTAGALPETAPRGTVFVPPFKPQLWLQAMRAALAQPVSTATDLPLDWNVAGRIVVDTLLRVAKNS